MLYVRYIGKKRVSRDHLHGSGKTWVGFGDIHPVETQQGIKLLEHTDTYEAATKADYDTLGGTPIGIAKKLEHPLHQLVGAPETDARELVAPTGPLGPLSAEEIAEIQATRAAKQAAAAAHQEKVAEIEAAAAQVAAIHAAAANGELDGKDPDDLNAQEQAIAHAESNPKPLEPVETLTTEKDKDDRDARIHDVNLSNMTKPGLRAYAKQQYNKDYPDEMTYPDLKRAVTQLRRDNGLRGNN